MDDILACGGMTLCLTVGVTTAPAHAGVIIDGTAPGYTLDGSFESGGVWEGSGSNLATDLGIDQSPTFRNTGTITDGSRYVLAGEFNGKNWGVYLDTGYDLSTGDTFDLSFGHEEHTAVGSTDQFKVQLFTTTTGDDSGTVDDIVASETITGEGTSSFTGIGNVPAAIDGERLFIAASPVSDGALFAFDAVNLSSNPIPEPASLALLGLGGLVMLSSRHRRGGAQGV